MENKNIKLEKDFFKEEKEKINYVINDLVENEPIFFPEEYWKDINILQEIYDKLNSIQIAKIKNGTFVIKTFNKDTIIAILNNDLESIIKITE